MPDEMLPFATDQDHLRLLRALRESELLRELAELLASSLDLDSILSLLVKRTTEVCEVERCTVWLLDNSQRLFKPATYHLSSSHLNSKSISAAEALWYRNLLPFDDPVIQRLLAEKGVLVLEDLHGEPSMQAAAETFLVRSVLLIALIREGRPVGIMSLDDPDKVRTFSLQQQQLARAIGQQAAIAIDNARLYSQAQAERRRAEQLIERARAIYQVALTVNSGEDLSTVLDVATSYLVRELEADGGAIALLEGNELRLGSTANLQQNLSSSQTSPCLTDLPNCLHAAMTGTPLFAIAQQFEDAEIDWFRNLGLENIMIVPLMAGTNRKEEDETASRTSIHLSRCVGFAFANYRTSQFPPSGGQFAFAQDIAAQCALAIEKAHLLSDARQAAALATERANTLDAIFHAMTEGITVLNQDGEVLILNRAASHFLGVPQHSKGQLKAFLGRYPVYTLYGQPITEEDFPLTRALRGERIRAERFVTVRADGTESIVELNIAPLLDSTKRQTAIVCAFRDITEQIRVERRIRQALETMLHVAEAVSGITEIPDILGSVLKMALAAIGCERGAMQLYDPEQDAFTPLSSIGFSQEAERQWFAHVSTWLTSESKQNTWFRTQLADGHATIVSPEQCPQCPSQSNPFNRVMVLAAPVSYNNHLLGLMMLDRSLLSHQSSENQEDSPTELERHDFTAWDVAVIDGIAQLAGLAIEQARWQQEAINARTSEAAMREANALKDEFLSITAHEFRTPLTVILAHSQIALRSLRRMAELERMSSLSENLSTIEEQTRQLTNIVNTFLEVTQLNRGQLKLKLAEVDLAEIAQQVVTDHSATSVDHQIRCNIESSEQPYLVLGDSARLLQIIANLVQNAIKYSPLGGPITVYLCQCRKNNDRPEIEVCVEDKGIGIPKEAQLRLFERFYRAPTIEGSKTKGIGLGLYVVAELLQMHGGTIGVESSGIFGEGSRFIFTLPLLEKS